jgi:hypothetical protein
MDHNHHASGHIVVSGKRIKLKKQMSKSKQKGTMAETAVVQYLKQFWPNVERRALQGSKDTGDIAGIPNVIIEIKNHKNYKIPEWIKETEQERENAGVPYGILIVKPNRVGTTKVGEWWAILPAEQIASMISELERLRSQQIG